MINRRTVEYEYKMISSFYDNYVKEHNYLNIKSVVVGYLSSNENDYKKIHKFHVFLLNLIIIKKESLLDNLNRCFFFAFNCNLDNNIFLAIKKIINLPNLDDAQKSLRLIELCQKEKNINIAFAFFVISGMYINYYYRDYVVIPPYLFEKLNAITPSYEIRDVFYKSLIELGLKYHEENLKDIIKASYGEIEELLKTYGIEELYLFGSIIDETYHDFSDIDIIIKMKENYDFKKAVDFLKKFNKNKFDRKTDIIEYDDFENINKNMNKIKVF